MALVAKAALTVSVEYLDSSGSKGTTTTYLPSSMTLADVITAVDALCVLLAAASDAAVLGYSVAYSKLDTATPTPSANSRVENRARLSFRTAVAKLASVTIPAPTAASIAASGGIVSTETNIAAVIAALGGGSHFSDSNGEFLDGLVADEQIFERTSKKQRSTDISPAT